MEVRPLSPRVETAAKAFAEKKGGTDDRYAVSHDGERFLMSQVSQSNPDEVVVVMNWTSELEE